MSFRFKMLAKKMIAVEERIAKEKGPLNLFALLRRWDAGGYHYLDLIIAADWAYRKESATRHYLIDITNEELEPEEKAMLGAFLVMNPKNDEVRAASRFGHIEHGLIVIDEDAISWRDFRRAYVITNNWPPTEEKARKPRKRSKKAGQTVAARRRATSRNVS